MNTGCEGNYMANISFKISDNKRLMVVCKKIGDCESSKNNLPLNSCLIKSCQDCEDCKKYWTI